MDPAAPRHLPGPELVNIGMLVVAVILGAMLI
jgi:hypothetical protein